MVGEFWLEEAEVEPLPLPLLDWVDKDGLGVIVLGLELPVDAVLIPDVPVLEGEDNPPLPVCAEEIVDVDARGEVVSDKVEDRVDEAAAATDAQYDADAVRQLQALLIWGAPLGPVAIGSASTHARNDLIWKWSGSRCGRSLYKTGS